MSNNDLLSQAMPKKLSPENAALIEREQYEVAHSFKAHGYFYGTIGAGQMNRFLDAARAEGPRSSGGAGDGFAIVPTTIADNDSVEAVFLIMEDFGCEDLSTSEAYAKIIETMARPSSSLPTEGKAAEPVETIERYMESIDAARRIHDWIDTIAAADTGKVSSREIRNYTFNEDDGGAVLYFRNNRVAAGGFMVRDLHNFTVSMKVFDAAPPAGREPDQLPADVVRLVKAVLATSAEYGFPFDTPSDTLAAALNERDEAVAPFADRVPLNEQEKGR